MVDYNKQKLFAFNMIERFAESGNYTTDSVCFFVERETGFGEKFTLTYIKKLMSNGVVIVEEGILMNKPIKEPKKTKKTKK